MKRLPVIFSIIIIVIIVIFAIILNQKHEFTVSTFMRTETISLEKKIYFDNTVSLKASTDDFIEEIFVTDGEYVQKETLLLNFENEEEDFLLSKAKNEYAMAVLNSGNAIQEEKKKAVELAEKRLMNTSVKSPIEGFVLSVNAKDNMFIEKGSSLFQIVEKDSTLYIIVDNGIEKKIKSAEYINAEIKPDNLKLMVYKDDLGFKDNKAVLKLPISLKELNGKNLDYLYCYLKINSYSEALAWIPSDYLNRSTVNLKDGVIREVEIIDKKNDLFLVKGVYSGDILTITR